MTAPLLVVTAPNASHDPGRGHPERVGRVEAAAAGVADLHLDDVIVTSDGRDATRAELTRVHDERYVDALAALARDGGGMLDPDTVVATGSFAAATRGAGCVLAAVEGLTAGVADAALVLVRPPGHHAGAERGSGFCLVNNVAVGAAALLDRGERVLIVDWDVHHGNGTQDVFWNDPRVLYVSTHQSPAYPGTGASHELGGPDARGLTLNFPLPPGATGDAALVAFDDVVAPAVAAFSPTWVLVSAGFDAHRADPLAELRWSAGDYAALTRRVLELVTDRSRVALVLEGGYDLDALRRSTGAAAAALAGVGSPTVEEPPTSGGPGMDIAMRTARALGG